jgi:hypothetical protein
MQTASGFGNALCGPPLKRTKELEPLLDGELQSFFGDEMSASLDLTALDVIGNILPGGRDVAQNACPAPSLDRYGQLASAAT